MTRAPNLIDLHDHGLHQHDKGLQHDLEQLAALKRRRRVLGLMLSGGAVLLAGCGGDDSSGSMSTTSSTTGSSGSSGSGSSSGSSSSDACSAAAEETAGPYSSVQDENFLRGVQVADANGQVTFQTIFPGCYSGRYPHIHFEIYPSLSMATLYTNKVLTAQMTAMTAAMSGSVSGGGYTGTLTIGVPA